jgi:hypothetical protein
MQLPPMHSCPAAQAMHAAPLEPHSALVGGLTQLEPLQQPAAQSPGAQYATHA